MSSILNSEICLWWNSEVGGAQKNHFLKFNETSSFFSTCQKAESIQIQIKEVLIHTTNAQDLKMPLI